MNIEFNYDISDCEAEELGAEIYCYFDYYSTGVCIDSIFRGGNIKTVEHILPHLSTELKDALRTALGVEEKPTEEEVFYKVGDRFKHCRGTYKLSSLGNNMVALVKIERYGGAEVGRIFVASNYDYSVKDPSHITKEEFNRLANGLGRAFRFQG